MFRQVSIASQSNHLHPDSTGGAPSQRTVHCWPGDVPCTCDWNSGSRFSLFKHTWWQMYTHVCYMALPYSNVLFQCDMRMLSRPTVYMQLTGAQLMFNALLETYSAHTSYTSIVQCSVRRSVYRPTTRVQYFLRCTCSAAHKKQSFNQLIVQLNSAGAVMWWVVVLVHSVHM